MNILVCVKQVPKEEDMKLDPVTKTLIRGQAEGTISEYDKYAVELALRLKSELGGKVTAISMGPQQSMQTLKYCLSLGVDDVYLLSDRAMGGADAYATVNVLAAAARHIEKADGAFDLFLFGKQASDSDTSLVMPQFAEAMGVPQASLVKDYAAAGDSVSLLRETENGEELLKLAFPAALSVGKTNFPVRHPNIKLKLAANRREIPVLNAESLGLDAESIGAKGSKTVVGDSYFPEKSNSCEFISGESAEETAQALLAVLKDAKLI